MKKRHFKVIISMITIFILLFTASYFDTQNNDYQKTFNKLIPENGEVKIAIISGIHSREEQSRDVAIETVKRYTKCQIDVYDVTSDPTLKSSFKESRDHGELLINEKLVDKFKDKDYDVIFVYHNHAPGYGANGLWLATPIPCSDSNKLADNIANDLGITNYGYKGVTKATSYHRVNIPLSELGFKVITVEFDESHSLESNIKDSLSLMDSALKFI